MIPMARLWLSLILVLTLFTACKSTEEAQKGSLGESCTRRDDCGGGLICVENRCTSEKSDDAENDGGTERIVGGAVGESCTRRADCQSGLACFAQICVKEADIPQGEDGVILARGGRGETCTARNDCNADLACVAGRCRENEYPVKVEAKECFRVQCETKNDCCKNFVPSASCDIYKAQCDADPSSLYCSYLDQYCVCKQTCQDSQCLVDTSCSSELDCNAYNAPFCVGTKCSQCRTKDDCTLTDTDCIEGVCRKPCERNEQCPLFYGCQSGKCVDEGCKSDRECYFSTNDPRAKCVDTECVTPCDNDAECTTAFNLCEGGRCVFAGCSSHEECRVYLRLQNVTGSDTAECRLPK